MTNDKSTPSPLSEQKVCYCETLNGGHDPKDCAMVDAMRGALRLMLQCWAVCPDCNGSGAQQVDEEEYRCRTCLGNGDVLGIDPRSSQAKPVDAPRDSRSILQNARAALALAEKGES